MTPEERLANLENEVRHLATKDYVRNTVFVSWGATLFLIFNASISNLISKGM